MTGVGGRPELVIEGSNDQQDWKVHVCTHIYNNLKYYNKTTHIFILTQDTVGQTCNKMQMVCTSVKWEMQC